jgi:SAM-dependent methyltransferase
MLDKISQTLRACRICGSASIENILDLGAQPPANSLRKSLSEPLQAVPLILCRCDTCGTVQLTETVAPNYLFSNYNWVTGTSQTANEYSHRFRDELIKRAATKPRFAVEVASNDGTFLKRFAESGIKVLGVDPARNIAEAAVAAGVPTITDFFGRGIADRIVAADGPADTIFARNVIPHVADADGVVGGMARCLSDGGVGAIEFHRADVILEEMHYDSIYHEHLFYHSLHSISYLLKRYGLTPFDLILSPISGGSFVVYFSKTARPPTPLYAQMWDREAQLGVGNAAPWHDFARRCQQHRDALVRLVSGFKSRGKQIIGYGASARSSTLLNYCQIDHRYLEMIADRSALKHSLYTPGTGIQIVTPAEALSGCPDAILLLAWNFRDEIMAQIQNEFGWRGDVILPLPGDPHCVRLE